VSVTSYAIGLGSNRRGRVGPPRAVVAAAIAALRPAAASRIVDSASLGPSARRFANAVVVIERAGDPPAVLAECKALERAAGRRRGRRWGARVLDLDLLLWSGGQWRGGRTLTVPHPALAWRGFVLDPLAQVAPDWRDPATGRTVRQLRGLLRRPCPVDRRS